MTVIKLCKNPTTEWLKNTYKAIPVLVPNDQFKPLCLIRRNKDDFFFMGALQNIFKPGSKIEIPISTASVSDASTKKTNQMKLDLGLKILGGFFKALSLDGIKLGASFNKSKEISLSFTDTQRHYYDLAELGNAISELEVNLKNPFVQMLLQNDEEFFVITDIITSKGFTVNSHTETPTEIGIDIPLIEKVVDDAHANISIGGDKKTNISFTGDKDLTFAFSCIEVGIDEALGTLKFIDFVSVKGLEAEVDDPNQTMNKKSFKADEMVSVE